MTLGAGAWHSERNYSQTEPMEFLQMWIMPNQLGLEPTAEQYQFTQEDRFNLLLPVFKAMDEEGPGIPVHQDVRVYASRLEPGFPLQHSMRPDRVGYLYLISGALEVNDNALLTGDAAKILGPGKLHFRGRELSELILVDSPAVE